MDASMQENNLKIMQDREMKRLQDEEYERALAADMEKDRVKEIKINQQLKAEEVCIIDKI